MIQSARFRCSVESVAMNTVATYGVAPTHSARTPRAPHRHRTGSRNGGAGACPTSCRVVPVNFLSLDSSRVLCLLRTDGLWRVEGRWRGRRDVTDGEGSSRIPGPGQVLTHTPTHPHTHTHMRRPDVSDPCMRVYVCPNFQRHPALRPALRLPSILARAPARSTSPRGD